jgi:hypothetical protein
MPGFDGTGPRGMGPMSGRGMGYCRNGYGVDYPVAHATRGDGWGFGLRRFFASPTNNLKALQDEDNILSEEIEALKAEKEFLKQEIEAIKKDYVNK